MLEWSKTCSLTPQIYLPVGAEVTSFTSGVQNILVKGALTSYSGYCLWARLGGKNCCYHTGLLAFNDSDGFLGVMGHVVALNHQRQARNV